MRSTAARTAGLIIGGLAVLVGGVWIGQGAGFIKGSFMTGSTTWLAIGLLLSGCRTAADLCVREAAPKRACLTAPQASYWSSAGTAFTDVAGAADRIVFCACSRIALCLIARSARAAVRWLAAIFVGADGTESVVLPSPPQNCGARYPTLAR